MKFNQIIKLIALCIMGVLLLTGLGCFVAGAYYTGLTNNAGALQDAGITLITLSSAGIFISHALNLKDEAKKEKDKEIK